MVSVTLVNGFVENGKSLELGVIELSGREEPGGEAPHPCSPAGTTDLSPAFRVEPLTAATQIATVFNLFCALSSVTLNGILI